MITEAIWEEKKYHKGSTRSAIRNFIVSRYDVDEDKLKENVSYWITKMLEKGDAGYPCLLKVEENYKLSPEWRKEWTNKYGLVKKQTKKKRTKKALEEPKYPRGAYLYYANEVRKRRQDQYPEKSVAEITKLLADEWKNLSNEKRKKYEEMAEEDRERYKKEMKVYKEKKKKEQEKSSGSEGSSSPRKKSRRKSENSEDSKRSPNKKRRRNSESDSERSKDKKERNTKTDSEPKKTSDKDSRD